MIATGYLAPLVIEECDCFTDHDPWLTLRGLELVFAPQSLTQFVTAIADGYGREFAALAESPHSTNDLD